MLANKNIKIMKFLGIDVGTGGSRAVLIDENGQSSRLKRSNIFPLQRLKSVGQNKIPKIGGVLRRKRFAKF